MSTKQGDRGKKSTVTGRELTEVVGDGSISLTEADTMQELLLRNNDGKRLKHDDVVERGDVEDRSRLHHLFRDPSVLLARCGISARVVVDQHDGSRI